MAVRGQVYLAPLKLAVVDAEGTLRLKWWPKNDAMKGAALDSSGEHHPLWATLWSALRCHTVGACCVSALALSPADPGGARNITAPLDNRNGTILEGTGAQCGAGSLLFYGAEGTDDVFEYATRPRDHPPALSPASWPVACHEPQRVTCHCPEC